MKKALALVLTLALCLAVFAGCGNNNAPSANANPAASSGNNNSDKPADGKVYNLTVSNHDAATSMCELWIETVGAEITEASGGRITFTYSPGGSLLGATEAIDGVKDGVADICWSSTSFFSGRFPAADFLALIGNNVESARLCSEVLRTMYNEIPEVKAEFDDWYVLAFHGSSPAPISTVGKKMETVSDFQGQMIRTAGVIPGQFATALGATPVTMPTSDVYESLEKNVINGCCNDWHNIDCFNIYEVIDYCMDTNISVTSCFLLMNKDTYNGLPEDLQAIIDKFAGGYLDIMAGYYWDSCKYWVGDKMKENGVDIYQPSDEIAQYIVSAEVVDPIHEWYINYLNDAGYDGQALYDQMMGIVDRCKEAHANDWDEDFHYDDWPYSVDTFYDEYYK